MRKNTAFILISLLLISTLGGCGKKAGNNTVKKTVDMLCGIMDNLRFSRENGLAKLHCLTAHRLDKEGSFMAVRNLYSEENELLLAKLMEANMAVDVKWIKENGFEIKEPFVLEAFKYAVSTAEKYEKLRNKGIFKFIRRFKRNG